MSDSSGDGAPPLVDSSSEGDNPILPVHQSDSEADTDAESDAVFGGSDLLGFHGLLRKVEDSPSSCDWPQMHPTLASLALWLIDFAVKHAASDVNDDPLHGLVSIPGAAHLVSSASGAAHRVIYNMPLLHGVIQEAFVILKRVRCALVKVRR